MRPGRAINLCKLFLFVPRAVRARLVDTGCIIYTLPCPVLCWCCVVKSDLLQSLAWGKALGFVPAPSFMVLGQLHPFARLLF